MDATGRHPIAAKVEDRLEAILFVGRWMLAPIYLGLLLGLVGIAVVFFREIWGMVQHLGSLTGEEIAVDVLSLIDLTLLGNLIVMVILAGFENFVSNMHAADRSPDKPHWMGTVGFSGLKLKLIGSLVAISAIQLLKDFLRVGEIHDFTPVRWQIAIHLTFVVSGLFFAMTDWISARAEEPVSDSAG